MKESSNLVSLGKVDLVFDMETADPDDFITLLLAAGHPRVNLKAVSVTPGGPDQIGLVRWALRELGREDVIVGSGRGDPAKSYVSPWHYRAYGQIPQCTEARPAWEVLLEACDEKTTFLEGAPLKNIGKAMKKGDLRLGRAVIMGGFAGENVVPPELVMKKFKGKVSWPSWNVGGARETTLELQKKAGILKRLFVSKNVTHRVVYNKSMHEHLAEVKGNSESLALVWQGMDVYLREKGSKRFHDPLAFACVIDESVCRFIEVELYVEPGRGPCWGSRLAPGSGTWISIDYEKKKFLDVLTEC